MIKTFEARHNQGGESLILALQGEVFDLREENRKLRDALKEYGRAGVGNSTDWRIQISALQMATTAIEEMNISTELKHMRGNLLDLAEAGEFDIVVHGCNCFNIMGGGIAKEIRERYPAVARADSVTCRGDYNKLGTYTSQYAWFNSEIGDNFTIINAYTQYDMSTGQDVFEYTAFKLILQKLEHAYPAARFGFPMIGMGLARGDRTTIRALLDDFAQKISKTGGSATLVEFA